MSGALLVHATAVALDGRAVLLRGPPGSGKSDLALRLIDRGARLVADDQCALRRSGDHILVQAPETIAGLIEIRGIGIVRLAAMAEAPLALLVDLVAPESIERLPACRVEPLLGLAVRLIALAPFEASAAAKLSLALRNLAAPQPPAIVAR